MKQKICIMIYLIIIMLNIASLLLTNCICAEQILNGNTKINIDYTKKAKDIDISNISEEIVAFSKTYDVNIECHEYLSEKEVSIYAVDMKKKYKIRNGIYPKTVQFISNKEDFNTNQSGIFYFPASNLQIKVYNFNEVYNIGIGQYFYIDTYNTHIINIFKDFFAKYGIVTQEENNSVVNMHFKYTLYLLSITLFLILFVFLILYFVSMLKHIRVGYVWGYKLSDQLIYLCKPLIKKVITISIIEGAICLLVIAVKSGIFLYYKYVLNFVLWNVGEIIFLFIFIAIMSQIYRKFYLNLWTEDDKLVDKTVPLIVVFRTILLILFFVMISVINKEQILLNHESNTLEYWKKTQNIYRIALSGIDLKQMENPEYDRGLNDRSSLFYDFLCKQNKAFLIVCERYIPKTLRQGNYFQQNIEQNMITVNLNYLMKNKVYDEKGNDCTSKIIEEKNTINIIVPEQFKKYENNIQKNFQKLFYFEKVTITNKYNKELNLPLKTEDLDDLNVNLIYVKKNQNYFTYSINDGDNKSNIRDPIAIIYNGQIDTSFIGAWITTSLFYENLNESRAYHDIGESINNSGMSEAKQVISLYKEKGEQIACIKWKQINYMILAMSFFIILVIVMYILISSYYILNKHKIFVHTMFGYMFFRRNAPIIFAEICFITAMFLASLYIMSVSSAIYLNIIMGIIELLCIVNAEFRLRTNYG